MSQNYGDYIIENEFNFNFCIFHMGYKDNNSWKLKRNIVQHDFHLKQS